MVDGLKRAWRAPLWAHALVLLLLMLVLLPLAKSDNVFFPDEGSGLAQAQLLSDGHGWTRDPSFPAVDPDFKTFPILNSPTANRIAPLGAHPTYAVVVEPWYAAFGAQGAALLSLVGLVVAAVLGARLTRRLRPGLETAALWAIGLGSPLFIDGFLVVAHTVGAVCIAGLVLAVIRVIEKERVALMIVVASALGVAAGMLRNEAVLLVIALGISCAFFAVSSRRMPVAVLGGSLVVSALVAYRGDALFRAHVLPVESTVFSISDSGGWLSNRVIGAVITLVLPSNGDFGIGDIVLVLAIVCAGVTAVIARRRPEDRSGLLLFGGLAVGLAAVRLVLPASPVPSLLVACPLITVGLVLGNRVLVSSMARRILSCTTVLFAAAVLLTQYGNGGGIQWGFRYFAIALPFVIPLALVAIVDGGARLSAPDRRIMLGLLVGLTALVTVLGFLSLRSTRQENATIVADLRSTYLATPPGDGGKPVVVTTDPGRPDRYNWNHLDETRWLIVDADHLDQLGTYLDRVRDLGIAQVTFLSPNIERDRTLVAGHGDITADRTLPAGYHAVTLRLAPSSG